MKILFVAPNDPRETGYGGLQRTHVLWKGLCSIPNSTVQTLVPVPHPSMQRIDEENRICCQCLEKRHAIGWVMQRLIGKCVPYCDFSWAYDWKAMHKRYEGVDVVVSRYIKPVMAFRLWELAPLFVDADDIHTLEFEFRARVLGMNLVRWIQEKVVANLQFDVFARSKGIWVPAQENLSLFPDCPFSVLPNIPCPPLPDVAHSRGDVDRLMFVGLMASDSNYLAIDFFLKVHWKALKREFPRLVLDVAGSGLPQCYVKDWSRYDGVNVLGYVSDIRKLYERSVALITPMVMGAGTCIKVLEALRMGRPVISTAQGLRGIPEDKRSPTNGIFQYESYDSLVTALRTVQRQTEDTRLDMAAAAISLVETCYSQRVVNRILGEGIGSFGAGTKLANASKDRNCALGERK